MRRLAAITVLTLATVTFANAQAPLTPQSFVTQVKAHARHKFTPVIMLTTEGQDEKKNQGRAAGAKAWKEVPSIVHSIELVAAGP